ncbi:MAG: hypothetical protein ACPGGK_13465 [Pikeienuella sp.]
MAASVFKGFTDGVVHLDKTMAVPLADTRKAHDQLESRNANGRMLLVP